MSVSWRLIRHCLFGLELTSSGRFIHFIASFSFVAKFREDHDLALEDEIHTVLSAQSTPSSLSKTADGEEKTYEDLQDEMVEKLSEKRASTRMVGLTRLIDELQLNVDYDFVSQRLETLEMYLLASVKKGDSSEVALACRALSLMALTLGTESDRFVSNATPILAEYLRNFSKSPSSRGYIAQCIGFMNFIGSPSDQDTLQAMGILFDQLRTLNLPEQVAIACWEAWGLLASTLPTSRLAGDILTLHFPHLLKYLDHESIDVKTAAGECIALLWEAKQEIEAERALEESPDNAEAPPAPGDELDHVDDAGLDDLPPLPGPMVPSQSQSALPSGTPDAAADQPMMDFSADFVLSGSTRSPSIQARKRPMKQLPTGAPKLVQQASSTSSTSSAGASSSTTGLTIDEPALISIFSSLAKDAGRSMSKKERATQKKNFREFLRTVEDGEVPDETIKIEKSRHEFSGWAHILQLDAIRDVVGKGLNSHFVHNETIQEIFDLFSE